MDEQELVVILRRLPVSVQITRRPGGYVWQCLAEQGKALDLGSAVQQALTALISQIVGDASTLDDLQDRCN